MQRGSAARQYVLAATAHALLAARPRNRDDAMNKEAETQLTDPGFRGHRS